MGMLYIRTSYILYVCEVYWDFKVYSKYGDIDSMYKYIYMYLCIYIPIQCVFLLDLMGFNGK
jgi:hypothetical protein